MNDNDKYRSLKDGRSVRRLSRNVFIRCCRDDDGGCFTKSGCVDAFHNDLVELHEFLQAWTFSWQGSKEGYGYWDKIFKGYRKKHWYGQK